MTFCSPCILPVPARGVPHASSRWDLDLERAREGGFAAGFFAVFELPHGEEERAATRIPDRKPPYALPLAGPITTEYAKREAGAIVDLLEELAGGGEVHVARSAADLEAALGGGPMAAILHFEGAEPIEPALGNLEGLYERGLRSVGLVWSRPNAFAEGVAFRFPSSPDIGGGLTEAGRRLSLRVQQPRDPDRPRAPERAWLLGRSGPVRRVARGQPLGTPTPCRPTRGTSPTRRSTRSAARGASSASPITRAC